MIDPSPRSLGKALVPAALAALSTLASEPTWTLGRDPFAHGNVTGKVEVVDGAVRCDGSNSFAIPAQALGNQRDYTIEFEVKRLPTSGEDRDILNFVSNVDAEQHAGLAFGVQFYPPQWRASALIVNGHPTLSPKAFVPGTAYKVTLAAKDGQLLFFLNGLLLGMTETVKPSTRPLTFGTVSPQPIIPYELRDVRIYDRTVLPSTYDPSAKFMRTYSGDQYTMERADVADPSRPRILVIGDSISMGYRRYLSEHYQGRAYVDYWISPLMFRLTPEDVAGDDAKILRAWRGVLANGPYNVITWNHATLHMWNPDKPERCQPETYKVCMDKIVAHVQALAPQTRVLWVRCTPVVGRADGKPTLDTPTNKRLELFNRLSDEVMTARGVPLVDLYAVAAANLDKVESDGAHWTPAGYRLMAQVLVAAIDRALPRPAGTTKESAP